MFLIVKEMFQKSKDASEIITLDDKEAMKSLENYLRNRKRISWTYWYFLSVIY